MLLVFYSIPCRYHICSCPIELPLFASMYYGFGCDYAIIYVNKIDRLVVCMRNVMCAKDIWEMSCRLTCITSSIQMFSVCISLFIYWNFHRFKLRNGVFFGIKFHQNRQRKEIKLQQNLIAPKKMNTRCIHIIIQTCKMPKVLFQ